MKNDLPPPIPPSLITPEPIHRQRRRLLALGLASPLLAVAGCAEAPPPAAAATVAGTATGGGAGGEAREVLTTFEDATTYNNFYEFGTGKADPSRNAHTLRTS